MKRRGMVCVCWVVEGERGVSEKMEIRKQTSGEDERGQCGSCWRPSMERGEDKERKIDEEQQESRERERAANGENYIGTLASLEPLLSLIRVCCCEKDQSGSSYSHWPHLCLFSHHSFLPYPHRLCSGKSRSIAASFQWGEEKISLKKSQWRRCTSHMQAESILIMFLWVLTLFLLAFFSLPMLVRLFNSHVTLS